LKHNNYKRELHIYLYNTDEKDILVSYKESKEAIDMFYTEELRDLIIKTTQTKLISTRYLQEDIRLFVHFDDSNTTEIKLGGDNEATEREIKPGHNLENLVLAGEFGWYD